MRSVIAVAVTLLLALQVSAGSQDGDGAQLESAEVLVDAVVLDKDLRPVTGLTENDFEVLEDGQPQPVTRVRAVATRPATDPTAESAAPPATFHTMVITDGTVTDAHLVTVRGALEKYVTTVMTPSDYVSLFTIGTGGLRLLQPLTNDKPALLAAIAKARDGGVGTLRDAERAGIDLARASLPTDAYSTWVAPGTEEGFRAANSDGLAAAPGPPPDEREIGLRLARRAIEQSETLSALGTSWTIYDALAALIDAHRVLPGRRSITMFSEGFLQVRQVDEVKEKVLNAAATAGVALYVVDARGLATESERSSTSQSEIDRQQNAAHIRGSDLKSQRTSSVGGGIFDLIPREAGARTDILAEFASKTGGLFMKNSNDLFSGLAAIDRDQRNYYLLYYAPKRPAGTGEYRKITVRVKNKPGLAVRARDGYFAIPADARGLVRLEDQRLYVRAHTAGAAKTLPLQVRAYAFGATGGGTRVSYALKLPPQAIGLKETKDKRFGGVYYALLVARDAEDRVLGAERVPLVLDLTEEEAKQARAEGLHHEGGFDVAAGEVSRVETIVTSEELGALGIVEQSVRGLDWSAGPALSDLVLGRAVVAAEPAGESSFVTGGKFLVPLAETVFSPSDVMNVLAAVYWPEGRTMKPAVLSIVQDKKVLASMEVGLAPGGGGANGWIFTAVPCQQIPPGEYVLRIVVRDVQGRSSVRETAFAVR